MRATIVAGIALLLLAASPAAAARRIAVLPLHSSVPAPQHAWIEAGLHEYVALLIAAQAGWEILPRPEADRVRAAWGAFDGPPSALSAKILAENGTNAALTGSYQTQGETLKIQADLYRDVAGKGEALHLSFSGKVGQAAQLASRLAETTGEALNQQFPRVLQPPQMSPLEFLPARLEPSLEGHDTLDDTQQNETFYLAALKFDPNNAEAYYHLGSLYVARDAPDKAIRYLKSAVELNPKSPTYHFALGVAHYRGGQPEEALTEFLQSTVIDETFLQGFVALAAVNRRLGDRAAGRAALEKAMKARPKDALVLTALGVHAYLAEEPATAREYFESALAVDPRHAAAAINLALLEWEVGDVDAARKELERAIAADPESAEALNNLAILDGTRGDMDEAARGLQHALGAGAPERTTLYNLGTLELQAGNLIEAEQSLRQLMELEPGHAAARNNLGVAQILAGRADDALATFGGARDETPEMGRVAYNTALVHHCRRSTQQALVHYLKGLQIRNDLAAAHINLGILFEEMGRPEKALAEYLKALGSNETHPEVYTYLGQIYAQRGYGAMADETIRKTILVDPGSPQAWFALATSQETALDWKGAASSWRQFLDAVKRDRARGFWIPIAEKRIAAASR